MLGDDISSHVNTSELARAFGVSDHTIRRYVDLLTSTFVVRQLAPWHENLRKRQVKRTAAPRITRSMRVAMEDLRLDSLTVVNAGEESFPLADGVQAIALSEALDQRLCSRRPM